MNREALKKMGLTDEQIESIMAEHGKTVNSLKENTVPKDQYNNISNQLKDTNTTLKDLQEKTKDNPDIQKQLQDAQTAKEQAEKDLQKLQTNVQLKEKLRGAGATDVDYMIFKLGEVEVNKDGTISDIDNRIKSLKEANPTQFEAEETDDDKSGKGKGGKEGTNAAGYKVKDTKLDGGNPPKTYTHDQLKDLTPQEINDNSLAVQAALTQGGK